MPGTPSCTVVINQDKFQVPQLAELQAELQSKDDERKISAVKQAILLMLNGEPMPDLLMTVIQYCIHTENHELKKLLMYYWEVVKKYDPTTGDLLPEMILVCNALRNDLISPNEFVRGTTLRFLCHITDKELLGPLVPTILENLAHRHPYVRRNAVLTVHSVFHSVPELIPEAAAEITTFLEEESDGSARRNAFFMLYNADEAAAMKYFMKIAEEANSQPEGLQLAILEFARKVCRANPRAKAQFIAVIFGFLSSTVPAIAYEAASTVMMLSSAPTAIRAAAQTFTGILCKEADNNIKLIVLERLKELQQVHPKVLREVVMDIMRVLSSPNLDIRKKTLGIVLELVYPRNVEDVVNSLKKEILKTQEKNDEDKSNEYRQVLVEAVHTCVTKFPEIAESVIGLLMDFLSSGKVALKVVRFVREMVEQFPGLRASVLEKLTELLPDITDAVVIRSAMWILGEYCEDWEHISATLTAIRQSMGTLPLLAPHVAAGPEEPAEEESKSTERKGPVVLADGSYATQSAATDSKPSESTARGIELPIRKKLLKGDYFTGAAIASTLTKLALRTAAVHGATSNTAKAVTMDALLVMAAILELGEAGKDKTAIDQDSKERIVGCIRTLGDPTTQAAMRGILLGSCRQAYTAIAEQERESKRAAEEAEETQIKSHADQLINVRQLSAGRGKELATLGLDDEADLIAATGAAKEDFASRLRRIHQLTGFADSVYAEAAVFVRDYDITLEMMIINRTDETLKELSVELATVGDLKLVDNPQSYTVAPRATITIKSNIKVSSTESAHIYGTIVYETAGSAEKTMVNLSDIHIDIMDYIQPATCSEARFREMWTEFEWENKVIVNTNIKDLRAFVEHMVETTHMACLTPPSALTGECNFLAANMYARSTFGEHALANVSIELRPGETKLRGHVRIRSKTQGVALSLGERIQSRMKV